MRPISYVFAVVILSSTPAIAEAASLDQCRNQALPKIATDQISLKTKQLNDLKNQIAIDTNRLINLTVPPEGKSACTKSWKTLVEKLYAPSLLGISAAQYSVNSGINDFSSQLSKIKVSDTTNCSGDTSLAKFMRESFVSASKKRNDIDRFLISGKNSSVIKADVIKGLDDNNKGRIAEYVDSSIAASLKNNKDIPSQIIDSLAEVEKKQNGWGILWAIEDCNGFEKGANNQVTPIKNINLSDYGITNVEAKKYFKKPPSKAELTFFKIKKNAYAYSKKLQELIDAYDRASDAFADCNKALVASTTCKSAELEEGLMTFINGVQNNSQDDSGISSSRDGKKTGVYKLDRKQLPKSSGQVKAAT